MQQRAIQVPEDADIVEFVNAGGRADKIAAPPPRITLADFQKRYLETHANGAMESDSRRYSPRSWCFVSCLGFFQPRTPRPLGSPLGENAPVLRPGLAEIAPDRKSAPRSLDRIVDRATVAIDAWIDEQSPAA